MEKSSSEFLKQCNESLSTYLTARTLHWVTLICSHAWKCGWKFSDSRAMKNWWALLRVGWFQFGDFWAYVLWWRYRKAYAELRQVSQFEGRLYGKIMYICKQLLCIIKCVFLFLVLFYKLLPEINFRIILHIHIWRDSVLIMSHAEIINVSLEYYNLFDHKAITTHCSKRRI